MTLSVDVSTVRSPVTVKLVSAPNEVTLACAAVERVPVSVPPETVPNVDILEDPTSMLPKPAVIDPEFKAPVVTSALSPK